MKSIAIIIPTRERNHKIKKIHEENIPTKFEYKLLNNSPLTKIELDLVKNSQNSYINEACCYCCCANVISEIIKRKFYRCYKCTRKYQKKRLSKRRNSQKRS